MTERLQNTQILIRNPLTVDCDGNRGGRYEPELYQDFDLQTRHRIADQQVNTYLNGLYAPLAERLADYQTDKNGAVTSWRDFYLEFATINNERQLTETETAIWPLTYILATISHSVIQTNLHPEQPSLHPDVIDDLSQRILTLDNNYFDADSKLWLHTVATTLVR